MEDIKEEILVEQMTVVETKEPPTKNKKNKTSKDTIPKTTSEAPVEVVIPLSEAPSVQETVDLEESVLVPVVEEVIAVPGSVATSTQETVVEIVDDFLSNNKPWYLSSSHIYVLVKNAVASIPYSQSIFDKTLLALCTTTGYINKSTNLNVVLETQDCYQLVANLDETVSGLLVRADDGFDSLREKLGVSLKELSGAISSHTAWAEQYTKQSVTGLSVTSAEVAVAMKSRYEKTLDLIQVALALAKDKLYAQVTSAAGSVKESATGYASDTYSSGVDAAKNAVAGVQFRVSEVHTQVDSTVMSALVSALKTAQPYVHSAVTTSTPYIVQAVDASQPYVARAMPYIDPLVARASDINAALSEHQIVGPYVTLAEETAVKAFEGAKMYCTVPEVKV